MIYKWEIDLVKHWTTNEIKNWIWMTIANNQATPGQVSVEAMRYVLRERGEDGKGYHNT